MPESTEISDNLKYNCKGKTMDIVMLAAGTSSRMGETNKMLLPYRGVPIVAYSCMQALIFLQTLSIKTDTVCRLTVVTGYRRKSVEKALKGCKLFVEKTGAKLEMLIVGNPNYTNGQFSSAKTGVSQVTENSAFFISLADMPLITAAHYEKLVPMLGKHDAVRPFYEDINKKDRVPGHPVLHAYRLKEKILQCPDTYTVNKILRDCEVFEPSFNEPSWILDIDTPENYRSLIGKLR
ncbi:MAG: NTP transferase domain-containing protein [Spirochaetales bacterium]